MSLQKLSRTGLLFEESYKALQFLKNNNDWTYAQEMLYNNGLASSKKRANELIAEIKKRFLINRENLPPINILQEIGETKLSIKVKKEILLVYLYFKDKDFAKIVDNLRDIAKNINFSPFITREEIKHLFLDYKKATGKIPKKKTLDNWIGRFISILREVNILIRKKYNTYIISLVNVQPDTWNFFALHCHFQNLSIHESPIFQIFNIPENHLNQYFEYMNTENLTHNLIIDDQQMNIEIKTNYQNLLEWIENKK